MQSGDAVGGVIHAITAPLEKFADHFRNAAIVFDEQNQPGLIFALFHVRIARFHICEECRAAGEHSREELMRLEIVGEDVVRQGEFESADIRRGSVNAHKRCAALICRQATRVVAFVPSRTRRRNRVRLRWAAVESERQ